MAINIFKVRLKKMKKNLKIHLKTYPIKSLTRQV
jgi:hypothetical protein